jgi:hypothetical protein
MRAQSHRWLAPHGKMRSAHLLILLLLVAARLRVRRHRRLSYQLFQCRLIRGKGLADGVDEMIHTLQAILQYYVSQILFPTIKFTTLDG